MERHVIFVILQNFIMTISVEKPIAIVANDAGAAAQIFAWLNSGFLNISECKFCLDGPAAALFKIQQPKVKLFSLNDVLVGAKTLLSGTGWSSSLEHVARLKAKNNGIKSVAVIDHWFNYKERFIRENVEILPDTIWVSDKYAYREATKCFPFIDVIEQRNDYMLEQVKQINSHKVKKNKKFINILYLLEPIRDSWVGKEVLGEFQALDFFTKSITKLNLSKKFSIILKPHPSDPKNKYDQWLNDTNIPNINIEEKKSLSSLIAWSDVVVGCETYAMVVALSANKRVISSLPENAHKCRLPFKEIECLNKLI